MKGTEFYRSTVCQIDRSRLRQNLRILKELAGVPLLLVVKANAYGHGLSAVSSEAEACGAKMLGVATVQEAIEIQESGNTLPILIMSPIDDEEVRLCVWNQFHFLAWSKDHFRLAAEAAKDSGRVPLIHLKINTGMNRAGIRPSQLGELLDSLEPAQLTYIYGVATHFIAADLRDPSPSARQFSEFQSTIRSARSRGLGFVAHCANSPATLRFPEMRMDMVRVGIAAYGLKPEDWMELPIGVQPILSWKANLVRIGPIGPGESVSYGGEYIARTSETIGTIAVGYADGYNRTPKHVNTVLVAGEETPVLGRVCMDQCVIRLPENAGIKLGDEVVLIGSQGSRQLSAELIASRWTTNNYDVVSGIRSRVPRHYL